MKNLLMAAMLCLSLPSLSIAGEKSLQPGDKMPKIGGQMQNAGPGKPMAYYDAMGKNGLLVMFSCNTCPFVVKNQPTTRQTATYASSKGVGVVIINSNEARRDGDDAFDAMKEYAGKQSYQFPYLVDAGSKLADAFGANHTPEIFLFDKEGKLVYKGAMNDNPGNPGEAKEVYINNAIDAMIAGKPVTPAETKSIGCSIKRKA